MANEIWASDANYPAGSDPWSGEPTKVAPTVGEIEDGHTPGVPVPAETENWWKNRTDTRLSAIEEPIVPSRAYWQTLQAAGNRVTNVAGTNIIGSAGHGVITNAPNADLTNVCTIDIAPGDNITDLAILVDPSGAAQVIVVALFANYYDGANLVGGPIITLTITDPPAGMAKYDSSNAVLANAPYVVPDDAYFYWRVTVGDDPTSIAAVAVIKDREP